MSGIVAAVAGLFASVHNTTNWSSNIKYCDGFSSCAHVAPDGEAAVQDAVRDAESHGRPVHAVGTRHSFSSIADVPATGVHVSSIAGLSSIIGLQAVADMDGEEWTSFGLASDAAAVVELEPGVTYAAAGKYLYARGLALRNYASLPHISVGGSISTWTHGSGLRQGSLATHVVGIRLVTGGGKIVEYRKGRDLEFFGAVVSAGGLGVITRLWLETIPAFDIAQCIVPRVLAAPILKTTEDFARVMGDAYSTSLFIDYSEPERFASVWRKVAVGPPVQPLPGFESDPARAGLGAESLVGGTPHDEACAGDGLIHLDSAEPLVPSGRSFHPVPLQPAEDCTPAAVAGPGHWRLPHFRPDGQPSAGGDELQSEFFVRMSDATGAVRALLDPAVATVLAPLVRVTEVRAVREDRFWLSPCRMPSSAALAGHHGSGIPVDVTRDHHGQLHLDEDVMQSAEKACVGLHFTWIRDEDRVAKVGLPAVLSALEAFRAVPHLGKLSGMGADEAGGRYESSSAGGVTEFLELKARLDPKGTFTNAYLKGFLHAGRQQQRVAGSEEL